MTADIILGTVNQVGNEIDEFVTGTLQNNLLGLPLDLASLNIARGRDTGVAPLNLARAQLFALSGEQQLKPYTSWDDFGSQLKHVEFAGQLHRRLRHACQPHHRRRNQRRRSWPPRWRWSANGTSLGSATLRPSTPTTS